MSISVVWTGIREAQAAFDEKITQANRGTRLGVQRGARAIEAAAKPETPVVTGTLRRSIHVEGPTPDGAGWSAMIGPSEIYGRRVELGFTGTDALGRRYNQPPNPYMGRGVASAAPGLPGIFAAAWAEAMGL